MTRNKEFWIKIHSVAKMTYVSNGWLMDGSLSRNTVFIKTCFNTLSFLWVFDQPIERIMTERDGSRLTLLTFLMDYMPISLSYEFVLLCHRIR